MKFEITKFNHPLIQFRDLSGEIQKIVAYFERNINHLRTLRSHCKHSRDYFTWCFFCGRGWGGERKAIKMNNISTQFSIQYCIFQHKNITFGMSPGDCIPREAVFEFSTVSIYQINFLLSRPAKSNNVCINSIGLVFALKTRTHIIVILLPLCFQMML